MTKQRTIEEIKSELESDFGKMLTDEQIIYIRNLFSDENTRYKDELYNAWLAILDWDLPNILRDIDIK